MFMDRMLFEKNSAYTRQVLVAATAVFEDCDLRKPEYILKIVKDSLERGMNENKKISMDGIKSEIKKIKENKENSSNKQTSKKAKKYEKD